MTKNILLICILFVSSRANAACLEHQMAKIERAASTKIGISAIHIETGKFFAYKADDHFQMASTVKLPIAVYLLHLRELGHLQLEKMLEIQPYDLCPGSGLMGYYATWPGLSISIYNLLESMMAISDNTATDIILKELGGPSAVYKYMQQKDFGDIHVDRSMTQLYMDTSGLYSFPPKRTWTLKQFKEWRAAAPKEVKLKQYRALYEGIEDTATPKAMTHLLISLHSGGLINDENRDFLLDIMSHSWGDRIKKLLPQDIKVAHKTGTWYDNDVAGTAYNYTSDVGIIALPDNKGHVAISVYTSSDKGSSAKKQTEAIGKVSKLVYDEFIGK